METQSLYQRLGGSPGIARLVDDVVTAHAENPVIGARFRPYLEQPERLAVIKQNTCAFFEMGSGGPAQYKGRSMRDAHKGMNVSATEYMAAIDDIMDVLRRHGADEETQKDVLAIAYSLKTEIVHL
jgi:hemoglobin